MAGAGDELETVPDAYDSAATVQAADSKITPAILTYFDYHQPIWNAFPLPEGQFSAELIDPKAMPRTPLDGKFSENAN